MDKNISILQPLLLQQNKMDKNISIGIIGLGRFGTLVASILKNHANVLVYSANQDTLKNRASKIGVIAANLEEVARANIVILTVPISQTKEMIRQIAPKMKEGSLLVDTCSVKVYPCEWLTEYARSDIEIMGTHPMFGPVSSKFDIEKQEFQLNGLQIVLCPLKISNIKLESIKRFLSELGLEVIITTPEDHDEQNAITLSLVHFLGRSLNEAGIKKQQIYTPGFENLLRIYAHTTVDDWQLFFDMNNYNPFAKKVRSRFLDACRSVEDKINENYEHTIGKS